MRSQSVTSSSITCRPIAQKKASTPKRQCPPLASCSLTLSPLFRPVPRRWCATWMVSRRQPSVNISAPCSDKAARITTHESLFPNPRGSKWRHDHGQLCRHLFLRLCHGPVDRFSRLWSDSVNKEVARIEPSALAILSKSEIDAPVMTATERPRDLQLFQHKIGELVTMSQATAEECFYELPARREGGEPIEGPSIRLAEILVSQFRNCRVQA